MNIDESNLLRKQRYNVFSDNIRRYERWKRVSRYAVLTSLLLGITLVILMARSERSPHSALDDRTIGKSFARSGKILALPVATQENRQEILISKDSGAFFSTTGDQWLLRDSSPYITVTPDGNGIIVVEKGGYLHVKTAGIDHFLTAPLLRIGSQQVNGFLLIPGTDSIYVYGEFPFIVALSSRDIQNQLILGAPNLVAIKDMAMDEQKRLVCVISSTGKPADINLSYGSAIGNLITLKDRSDSAGSDINKMKSTVITRPDSTKK